MAGLAVGGGLLLLARRHGASLSRHLGGGGGGDDGAWTCACGTRFRTVGAGRHQVFWLLDGPEGDPVLGDLCPSCERPLPGRAG
jgi:hypothetical protein